MWAKSIASSDQRRIDALLTLEAHQLSMEAIQISKDDIEKYVILHQELHVACRYEEDFWRQKSRCLWLKVGDQNTTFFHKHVEMRKNYKIVQEIQTHDQVIQDFDKIKLEAS